MPEKYCLNLDLSSIKIPKIFKWLKEKNISDKEMMRTFNCGIGFCVILPKKNIKKVVSFFPKSLCLIKLGLFLKIEK